MPKPNDAPVLGNELYIFSNAGMLELSDALARLLVKARENYAWPKTRTAEDSQKRIEDLERQVQTWTANLDGENAQLIVGEVSEWGGNNSKAKEAIRRASHGQKQEYARLIGELLTPSSARSALQGLTEQRGVGFVMATKIYRFCVPREGAAIDRHTSYFFNSLQDRRKPEEPKRCTEFCREWSNGKHGATRLATYYNAGREWNLRQYFDPYLPLLGKIAGSLNRLVGGFLCAACRKRGVWRPTDVEMAAYQWWSRNGPG